MYRLRRKKYQTYIKIMYIFLIYVIIKMLLSDRHREAGSQKHATGAGRYREGFCKSGIIFLGSVRDGKVFQTQ